VQNEIFRLKAELAYKDSKVAALEKTESENGTLREKVAGLRSVLLTARESLAELPKLQENCLRLEAENKAHASSRELLVSNVILSIITCRFMAWGTPGQGCC
jgi:hypothetical protein